MPEKPQRIEDAIESYADRSGDAGRKMIDAMGTYEGAAEPEAYSGEFMALIYAPRVRKLFELKAEGFTHAEWKWNPELGHNDWHGAEAPVPSPTT